MDAHKNTDVAPQELQRAQSTWANFANATKWGIIIISAVLLLMGLVLA